VLAMI